MTLTISKYALQVAIKKTVRIKNIDNYLLYFYVMRTLQHMNIE